MGKFQNTAKNSREKFYCSNQTNFLTSQFLAGDVLSHCQEWQLKLIDNLTEALIY
jgi:hypothetical protein